jgi:hypothetical protein
MSTAFRRIEMGLESTRGLAVAAEKRVIGTLTMTPEVTLHRPSDENNSLAEFHRQIVTGQMSRMRFEGDATYDQLIDWLGMTVRGGITPDVVETTGRIWTFTHNLTAKNVQNTYTIEYGNDNQVWEAKFALADSLELGIALGEVVTLRVDLFANFASKTSFSGSSELAVTELVANHLKVYIDGTYANLGTTHFGSGLVVAGATVRIANNVMPVKYADGALEFNSTSEGKSHLEIDMDIISSSNFVTEYDAYVAGTQRAIRLEFTGPIAVGSTNYKVTIDAFGRWVSPPEIWGERDGEDIVRMQFQSNREGSSTNHYQIAVTNLITAV